MNSLFKKLLLSKVSLLASIAIVIIACTCAAAVMYRTSQAQEVVDEHGGYVVFDNEKRSGNRHVDTYIDPIIGPLRRLHDISSIVVYSNDLDDFDIKLIADGCNSCESIAISSTKITNRACSAISGIKGVHYISLWSIHVDDDGLRQISNTKSLLNLHIDSPEISDEGVTVLAEKLSLLGLSLSSKKIKGLTLGKLARMKRLNTLDLSGTSVSDDEVRNVIGISSLKHLILHGTRVSQAGIDELRLARPTMAIDFSPKEIEWPTYTEFDYN